MVSPVSRARSFVIGALILLGASGAGLLFHESHTAAQAPAAKSASPADPAALHHANELSRAFRSAANAILPSVVTIETETKAKLIRGDRGLDRRFRDGENPFRGTPFEDFFRDFSDEDMDRFGRQFRTPRQEGAGSGVIIDSAGVILTNNHVVRNADVVTVRLADGREFKGTDVKTDPQSDLAIVRISGAGDLPAAKLGDSDQLEIGDWVIAVGNPFGLEQTVSAGIISGKGRNIGAAQRAQFLQTDAAINPGNSGGPLVNLDGEVIGINTAIASNGGGNDGIGFAVPSNLVRWVAPQLIAGGKVQRAYLGVTIGPLSSELAEKFGTKAGEGVVVTEVFPNSPAAEAGIREGDVILDYDGVKVHNPRQLQEVVERSPLNTKQRANILRDGKPTSVEVTARPLPAELGRTAANQGDRRDDGEPSSGEFTSRELGLDVSDLTPDLARRLGFEGFQGVLVTGVEVGGLADDVGLREGMLIRKVGQRDVRSVAEFQEAMAKQSLSEGVLLLVRTEQGNRYVVLQKK